MIIFGIIASQPYDVGTMTEGFYDIEYNSNDEYEQYEGRIMIFEI